MTIPQRASARPASRSTAKSSPDTPSAVLIDGSALFLTSRSLFEGRQLDYRRLVQVLHDHVPDLRPSWAPGPDDAWTMWTSASAQNEKQSRFLEIVEKDLRWDVRKFSPGDSYLVDPGAALGLGADSRLTGRFMRFDAQLAFAAGRLADKRRLVVISDSFTLADPLRRAALIARQNGLGRPVLAFFSRALDPRWQRTFRQEDIVQLLDLDEHLSSLYGEDVSQPYREEPRESSFVY